MKRMLFPTILVSVFCFGTASLQAQSTAKKNVLFIVIDDLNDYVSVLKNYPGIKMPNLDKLAKSSINFTHSYCAVSVCNPSRAAVLSGVQSYHTGVYDNNNPIQASEAIMNTTFLPEQFKANGYTTITRGKIFHTKPPKERYAAMWDIDGGQGDYGPVPARQAIPDSISKPMWFNYEPWTGPESDHPDNVTAEFYMKKFDSSYDKPFFMACGLYKPHNPWSAPKRFFDMYPLDQIVMPEVFEKDWDDLPEIAKKWVGNPVNFQKLKSAGQWKPVVRSYLACISFMDWNLGRIIEALDKSKYKSNTIVCLFADNGFHMGEKEHFAKYALWEQTTHILFLWRVPSITKGGVACNKMVNLIDIYPTLQELCGLSSPKQKLDGRSIVPLLKNPNATWNYPSITTYKEGNQAVRTEKYRYIHYNDGSEELYDEEKDPKEWYNIANESSMQAVIGEMKKYLQKEFVPAVAATKGSGEGTE